MKEREIDSQKEFLQPLLEPPREFLDGIQFNPNFKKSSHSLDNYCMKSKLPTTKDVGFYINFCGEFLYPLMNFYKLETHEFNNGPIMGAMNEVLINSVEHGNKSDKGKEILFGLWVGRNGIIFALRDEGDFFSRTSNKKLIESRTIICSTRKKEQGGMGFKNLYKNSDKIYVSNEQNALFVAVSKEKFLKK